MAKPALAVIGLGAVGRIHAANIAASKDCELALVCDIREDVANEYATIYNTKAAKSFEEVLAAKMDAVIISSSTATHGKIAHACIEAGVAFLCEKPLATDLADAKKLVELADAKNLVAATALNRRFDEQYSGIRDAAKAGEIGKLESLHISSRTVAPPTVEFVKTSGGLFGEKGAHFYDLARWISGEEPCEVFAMGSVLIDQGFAEIGEVDTALVSMRMPSGLLCQFSFSWRSTYGQDERLELHGSDAMLQTQQAPIGPYLRFDGSGLGHSGLMPTWQERFAPTYQAELDAFLFALEKGDAPVLASLADGLAAQQIAQAAKRSAKTGERILLTDKT